MSDDIPPIWESILSLDWYNILVWIYDKLPFEIKSYIWMIIITILFVLALCMCCCAVCFCSPCCVGAIWLHRRRAARNRAAREDRAIIAHSQNHPSAPPLLSKV